jgi:hypothetical protein
MWYVDNATSVPAEPSNVNAGSPGWFSNGNPGIGAAPTILDADFMNMLQAELLGIVQYAGLTPAKNNNGQLVQALTSGKLAFAGVNVTGLNAVNVELPTNLAPLQLVYSVTAGKYVQLPPNNAAGARPAGMPVLFYNTGSVTLGILSVDGATVYIQLKPQQIAIVIPANNTDGGSYYYYKLCTDYGNLTELSNPTYALSVLGGAPLASPNLTGSPYTPTPPVPNSTGQIPNTYWVNATLAAYAALASPAFSGAPTVPTALLTDFSATIANTYWVKSILGQAMGATGYQYIQGNSGNKLIMQWGRCLTNSGSIATFTFPVAFPNQCSIVLGNITESSGGLGWYSALCNDYNTGQCSFSVGISYSNGTGAGVNIPINALAIGY